QCQHRGQSHDRPHSRVAHWEHGLGPLLGFCCHRLTQFCDVAVHLLQDLQQVVATSFRPRLQCQALQLLQPCLAPQLPLLLQALVHGNVLQLVLGPGSHLHQRVPVLQQLPQIPLRQRRDPDRGKPLLQQQLQHVPRISWVAPLVARRGCPDGRSIPDPQLVSRLFQQALKPQGVAAGLDSHQHRPAQRLIKLLRLPVRVQQPALSRLSALGVYHGNLLKARMKITTYNLHDCSFRPRALWVLKQPQFTWGRGAVVVIQSSEAPRQSVSREDLWRAVEGSRESVLLPYRDREFSQTVNLTHYGCGITLSTTSQSRTAPFTAWHVEGQIMGRTP